MYLIHWACLLYYCLVCCSHLTDGSSCMSDEERDGIDGTAEQFMRNCSESIHSLQRESKQQMLQLAYNTHLQLIMKC